MNEAAPAEAHQRLRYLIDLVDREAAHLAAVRQRLLGDSCVVDAARADALLTDDTGVDRLESFGAKFGRMQDTVMDKLVPAVLRFAGELPVAAIDNLLRMERLGLVDSADDWLAMRQLRNRLVHEYIESPADLAEVLSRACRFSMQMQSDYRRIRQFATDRMGMR